MDDVRARGFLFAGHRGICAIASTFCYVWTRALGQEERSVQKFKEKATWLSKVDPDGLWDLFSWLSPRLLVGELPRPVLLLGVLWTVNLKQTLLKQSR